jgi:catechol 2,3-dioxygenase-like lactoylglutathione lyase family enzyme
VNIQFITGIAVITPEPEVSHGLYLEALGLPLTSDDGQYFHSEDVPGSRHFGVWPLRAAAQACFGSDEWPADRPTPQASIEFEVADPAAVATSAAELRERGFDLLHESREEPWGQTVARLQSVEGLVIGISFAPQMH